MAQAGGLLVKVRGQGVGLAAVGPAFAGFVAEPILTVPPGAPGANLGAAASQGATWLKLTPNVAGSGNPWDDAHNLLSGSAGVAAAASANVLAVEPDIVQRWDYKNSKGDRGMAASASPACTFDDQDPSGGQAIKPGVVAWNAGPAFSQFTDARNKVGAKQSNITIAHLDTGFDPGHRTRPAELVTALQRNFVDGGAPNDATDHAPVGTLTSNRGHGTGTLSLLAGNKLDGTSPNWPGFTDFVGGAPLANVIPVRIADWVVRLTTGTMVQGIDYARLKGAQVLSMSMGGLTSQALVDAVNLAYDNGVVMVTAAGNNFTLTPRSIVFPARYNRVLAACGVMADGRAYSGLSLGTMQGNYGPPSKMATAIGAYTPNVPWAEIDCAKVVDMDGNGTSAATPQIAAAAALWLAEHWDVVKHYSQPWMRVEAVRHALFSAAAKSTPRMSAAETLQKAGQGVLRADAALLVMPLAENLLKKLPPARYSWGWLDLFTGGGNALSPLSPTELRHREMLALELTQMAQNVASVDQAIADPDGGMVSSAACNRYLEAALDEGNPSKPLRAFLEGALGRKSAKPATRAATKRAPPIKRKPRPAASPKRRLRIYALDPSIAKQLDSVSVFQATLSVPWDDGPPPAKALLPGPIGEYLEVVDVDPASNRVYDPVDLNDKILLAQDGLTPSEGNPQFHQQMVYAVAMTTIGHFERALGRRALWAPHYTGKPGSRGSMAMKAHEVPRLRIYPHALRAANAYYSPDKKALLFGYFPAESKDGDVTTPGTTVFSCLSNDIVAHEMSHALLDGLHRLFEEASNPDVPAFHEAFADIVALFQHFTLKELVSFAIAKAKGDVSVATLLSGIAAQFGEGSGRAGPLRDYGGPGMAALDYTKTFEPHDRGSILVFAVYQAFLAIADRRTDDLIQLATGGTGVLPAGTLHPSLVERLTDETAKVAQQMLTMCIRALDYCPAVDITFGEYLRALITADIDAYPDDPLHYRLAFIESFRRWKLLPRDVRTISEETLAWSEPDDPSPRWLKGLLGEINLGWNQELDRSEIFALNEDNRYAMWEAMHRVFAAHPAVHKQFGLLPNLPRYDDDGTLLAEAKRGETTFSILSVRPTRRVEADGSFRTEVIAVIQQRIPIGFDGKPMLKGVKAGDGFIWFRGGATLIIDPREGKERIRYSIIKNTGSLDRRERQAKTATANFLSPLRALYFGGEITEPFALLHASDGDDDHV
ncbi:peptidase S8 [Mesorhizobium sp. M1C.F.Ca.ET.193.01.1.1]|nr:peptidase S8 [Mesorhizobium sp. M1C.F.Ca.ET.210.01.1.1]TGQ75225.1 peptidase S8 [Mesorhizobium sp. M1C.F.Ca.ET.212.01.1.1]TGR13637.1 peptidase S8 [Mesorhizobium sp. M1C.F.Ca.ET.204.01.1.1]TGR33912.1 peptidase S8 [Mesorhizobium sp. M1C.F.Ca.ET.196.01.1.1]TGR56639.1 peptidase S8 [Mesorhizobium sp. M1C.F.Ca.ET.195.01.1.1]TGR68925.1 peptidase S8 [Mesorhizobium sp. M1C.F.Ca.ET.192.01.1.1]TGR84073.1 peptidase S8 [Mesorhizobium sp. M1C.F.Ca.ET.189.01.1.1]TGR87084.1 peptidase S8 [Mesorhizobium sp.